MRSAGGAHLVALWFDSARAPTETSVGRGGMSDSDREAATKCTRSVAAAHRTESPPWCDSAATQPPNY